MTCAETKGPRSPSRSRDRYLLLKPGAGNEPGSAIAGCWGFRGAAWPLWLALIFAAVTP